MLNVAAESCQSCGEGEGRTGGSQERGCGVSHLGKRHCPTEEQTLPEVHVRKPAQVLLWGDHLPKLHSEEETNGFLLISGAASAQAWSAQPQLHLQFGADLNQSGTVITPNASPVCHV